MSAGTRPDAPTGGRLIIRKGATWDTEYHGARETYYPGVKDAATPARKKRRCLFCGRPMLLMLAPVLVVVVFTARNQRSQMSSALGNVAGYSVTLDAVQDSQGTHAAVLIRRANSLAALLRRSPVAEAGSPIEVLFSYGDAGLPMLVSGQAPGSRGESEILRTVLPERMEGIEVFAEVNIGEEVLTLKRAAEPAEVEP